MEQYKLFMWLIFYITQQEEGNIDIKLGNGVDIKIDNYIKLYVEC